MMTNFTLVQIDFSFTMSVQEYLAMGQQVAGVVAEQPGLLWKIWPLDAEGRRAGGVYLFDNKEDAVRYVEGPIITQLPAMPGIHNVDVVITDVAADLSAITHAPLSRIVKQVA